VIVIFCSFPVPEVLRETLRMPFASMSNVTSICGMPRGAGGIPTRWKHADRLVVASHLTLALEDLDLDRRLVVARRREGLALLRGDRRVALDELRRHAAQRLDAERQRRHVEQQEVLDVAREDAALDRRADRDDLVRVDALVGVLPEELLDEPSGSEACGSAADENDLVDLRRVDVGVLLRLLARPDGLLDDVLDELLELRAREPQLQVLRARGVRRDERQVGRPSP
jgi:hypothetical protein